MGEQVIAQESMHWTSCASTAGQFVQLQIGEKRFEWNHLHIYLLGFRREKMELINRPVQKMVTPEEDGTPAVENIGLGGWGGSCHKRRWAAIGAHMLRGKCQRLQEH